MAMIIDCEKFAYVPKTDTLVAYASDLGLLPGEVPEQVLVKQGPALMHSYGPRHEDLDCDGETAGWTFNAGQGASARRLLIIND